MSFEDFLVGLRARHPDWFGLPAPNAGGCDSSPVATPKATEPEKPENVPRTPGFDPATAVLDKQSQAAGDDWDAADVVETEQTENWWDL